VHFGQDVLGKRLWDLVEVAGSAGFLDALGLVLGEGLDMAPGGVLKAGMLAVSTRAMYNEVC